MRAREVILAEMKDWDRRYDSAEQIVVCIETALLDAGYQIAPISPNEKIVKVIAKEIEPLTKVGNTTLPIDVAPRVYLEALSAAKEGGE